MTAEQKTTAARFLDLLSDHLRGGYRGEDRDYHFQEDAPPASAPADAGADAVRANAAVDAAATRTAAPADTAAEDADPLAVVAGEIGRCTLCSLCRTRTKAVPGEGAGRPLVMVIGEGPGADEDATGRPFVGRA
ncbi:MAG: uracil-DNA glycosylase, partial [Treponema sp.]|nr:uracil-DNA glycosylase [Treponema sp.]